MNSDMNDVMISLSKRFDFDFENSSKRMPLFPCKGTSPCHHYEPQLILRLSPLLSSNDDNNDKNGDAYDANQQYISQSYRNASSNEALTSPKTTRISNLRNRHQIRGSINNNDNVFHKMSPKLSMTSVSLLKIKPFHHRADLTLSMKYPDQELKNNYIHCKKGKSKRIKGETTDNTTKITEDLSVTPDNNQNDSLLHTFVPSLSPSSPSSFIKSVHHAEKKKPISPTINSSGSKVESIFSTTEFVYQTPIKTRKRMPILPHKQTVSHHFKEPKFILQFPSDDESKENSDEQVIFTNTPLNVNTKKNDPIPGLIMMMMSSVGCLRTYP